MKLSIVVAVRNGGDVIKRCIESVLSQKSNEVELIVIDGGSTDDTVDIIRSYGARIHYWESASDRGIAHAWNKGVDHASGDWILFLGADDSLLDAQVVGEILPHLEAFKDKARVVYAQVLAVDGEGKVLKELSSAWNPKKFVYFGMYFCHQGVFQARSLFAEHGGFDESYKYGLDYEFLLRHLINHDAVFVPDVTVAKMQLGGVSTNPVSVVRSAKDLARARRKHGIQRDSLLYYRALAGAYAKLGLSRLLGNSRVDAMVRAKYALENKIRR